MRKSEKNPRKQNDLKTAFIVAQIKVNTTCLEGETGEAIVQAHEMYDKAKDLKYSVGRALSLQAMGDTYMHAGLYALAAETFWQPKQNSRIAMTSL